jgi:outer membrane protein insertion porin family
VGGSVELGAFDYALWRGGVELYDLHIHPDRARLPFEIQAQRAELRFSPLGRVRVRLEGPELTLFQQESPVVTSDRSLLARLNPLTLSRFDISNGTVRLLTAADEPWLEVRSVGLELERLSDRYHARVQATNGTMQHEAAPIVFGPLEAVFEMRDGELQIVSSRVGKEDSRVELNGTATSLEPFLGHFDVDFRADAAILRELWPETEPRGVVEGNARLDGEPDGVRVAADFRSAGLAWNGLEPWGMTAEASLANDSLRIENASLTGYGGTVRAAAQIDLAGERQSLQIDFDGLDLHRAAGDLSGHDVPLTSRATGHLELSTAGWNLQVAEGRGRVTLEPSDTSAGTTSFPARGEILLTLRDGTATLETERLATPQAELALTASLEPIDPNGSIDATYRVQIDDVGAMARLAPGVSSPIERLDLEGGVTVRGHASGPLSDISWNGTVSSQNLAMLGEPYALDAELRLARNRLRVDSLSLLDLSQTERAGTILVEGEVPLALRASAWELHGDVDSFGVGLLSPFIEVPVAGRTTGSFEVTGSFSDPDCSAEMRATELRPLRDGELSVTLRKRGRDVIVDSARLVSPAGSVEASGSYQLDESRVAANISAQEIRLADLPLLAEQLGEVDGVIESLEVELQGPVGTPAGLLRFTVREPSLQGLALPNLDVELTSNGETAELEARLDDGQRLLTARGEIQSPYPIEASLDLSVLPLERLLQSELLLADPEVLVQARGELELAFPLLDPSQIQYRARVEQVVGSYHGIGGGAGSSFLVEGDLQSFRIEDLDLVGNLTAIAIAGRVPLRSDQEFDLRLRGDARLELLEPAFEDAAPAGRASADLHVRGTLDQLDLAGDVSIEEGEGTIHGVNLRDVNARIEAGAGRVRLQSLTGKVLDGEFHIEGELPLPSALSSETTRLEFEVTDVDLARVLPEEEEPTSPPTLKITASGSFETPSASLLAVIGSGSISRIEAGFGELTISNPEPATWSLAAGRFELPELRLTEAETDVRIGMTANLTENDVSWEASLVGRVDNALVNPLVGSESVVASGTTALDLRARGTSEDFYLAGTGTLRDARLVLREPPLAFSNLSGEMQFEGQRITLSELAAEVGGGRVEGSGTIDLPGVVDLRLTAESVRLNYPEGLRSEQSGSFRLSGGPESYLLSGDLWLNQSLFNEELTLEAGALESMPGDLGLRTSEDSFSERLRLEIRAQTVEDLRIDNDTAELQAAGNLVLSGTLASPEIDGIITVRPDGTFRLGRNDYRIDSGQMVLRSFPTEAPELDLTMRTTVSEVSIVMQARGPLDDLRTDLSAPEWYGDPLTQADLASLLLTGRTIQNVGDLDTISEEGREFATEQAVSILGASLAGLAESGLGQVLPFRTITVDPAHIASEVDPNARFTLGVGVTEDFSVTYSVALSNSQSRLWIVDYLLPKNVELRGTQLEDEFTGGVSQRLFFNFHQASAARRADSRRRVELIRLVGAPPELEGKMEEAIDTESDERYDYWKTIDDARRLSNILREQGYLGALVDVQTVPVEEDIVDLVYLVDPGAMIEIVWRGDDPGNRIREAVEDAWDGRVPESLLVTELARLALRGLRQERYYRAAIETTLENAPEGSRRAIFQLARGPRSAGLDIEFQGNNALSDEELRGALPSESSPDLYELIFTNPRRLGETIERFYASRGYVDAHAGDITEVDGGPGGRFRVLVPVEEGDVSRVATVELEGAASIPPRTLLDRLSQRPGEPFRFSAYQQDRSTLSSIYRREGFADVRVRGRLERAAEGLAVVYAIDEGPRAVVGNIRVIGNQVTRTSIIRRQLTFQEGDPLRHSDLTDSQKRLYDLGIFRFADVRVEPVEVDAIERDVVVEVIETSDLNVGYGLRYSTEEGFQIQTQLETPNVFGGGQHVGLTVRADRNESLVRATFHTPYLFSRFNVGTNIFVSRETEDSEFFFDRFWSLTFQQDRPLTDWMELQWSYSFRRTQSEDKFPIGPIPLDVTIYKNILSTSLITDRRDSLIRPARGHYWSVTLQGAPTWLRNDVPFIKTFGQLITFVPLGHDVVWAASYRLGVADNLGEGVVLLPDDRFKAGGIDSVRGFAQDSLGPKFAGSDEATGGKAIAVFNQELRFPIYRWFHGGAFFDAGNVYLERSDFDPLDLRYSAGVGLRVLLPFGLFRLDWARALDREPGEDTSQFWFSFGHAF